MSCCTVCFPTIGRFLLIAALTVGSLDVAKAQTEQMSASVQLPTSLQETSNSIPPPPDFTLTLTLGGNGTGLVSSVPTGIDCGSDCTEGYDFATAVTLTATPDTGSTFTGFSGDADCSDGSVSMTVAVNCTATFTLDQYVLTTSTDGNGSGSVNKSPDQALYDHGSVVTLTATPDTGSAFTGWSGGGCSGTGSCLVTMDSAQSVTATFDSAVYTIGGTVSGLVGSGLVLRNNDHDDLAINSIGVFTFDTAMQDGSTYDVRIIAQPERLVEVCVVSNGSGTVNGAAVTDVMVTCETQPSIFKDSFEDR